MFTKLAGMPLFAPVNLKKVASPIQFFVLFLTFLAASCGHQKQFVSRIEGREIGITPANSDNADVENLIKPYRDHIDADLNTVLAYAPEIIDKNGKWQTPMGNLFSDVAMKMGNPIFLSREHKNIDFIMLNHGGIRQIIPKGDVTTRSAFEIMPFENTMVVAALKGEQVMTASRKRFSCRESRSITMRLILSGPMITCTMAATT